MDCAIELPLVNVQEHVHLLPVAYRRNDEPRLAVPRKGSLRPDRSVSSDQPHVASVSGRGVGYLNALARLNHRRVHRNVTDLSAAGFGRHGVNDARIARAARGPSIARRNAIGGRIARRGNRYEYRAGVFVQRSPRPGARRAR